MILTICIKISNKIEKNLTKTEMWNGLTKKLTIPVFLIVRKKNCWTSNIPRESY